MEIQKQRQILHKKICSQLIYNRHDNTGESYPNFSDSGNRSSRKIAKGIVEIIGQPIGINSISEQTAGGLFESLICGFIQSIFDHLGHLRPGNWRYLISHTSISGFVQYAHLSRLADIVIKDQALASAIGTDYMVKPDIVIARHPVSDEEINCKRPIVDDIAHIAKYSPLRLANYKPPLPILHASISCKWTIRSDRSQNTRTEALNLIRNRKGPLPHIMAVTAEPLPTRIAALVLGTGDLDCVYHFALPELIKAIETINNPDQLDMLTTMIDGNRLRDISDLPLDLAI